MIGALAVALILLAGLLSPALAQAWTLSLSWAPTLSATTYKVEKSVDGGLTWTVLTATLTSPVYVYAGSELGLTLFRLSACNASGCTLRAADGLWHNEAWQPPLLPTALTLQ